MKFKDNAHKQFYEQKYQELQRLGKVDVYYTAIIYTLAMCSTTREHFSNIVDLEKGTININALQAPYQTGTSLKVTKMAFNLWNGCYYDSQQDLIDNKVSIAYSPNELFSCGYAPYFYQAIMIRYPEYTSNLKI